jgi:hypothetical protein
MIRLLAVRGITRAADTLTELLFPESRPASAAQMRRAQLGADRFVHVFDPDLGPVLGHHLNFNQAIWLEIQARPGLGGLFHGRVDLAPEVVAALPVRPFFVKGAYRRAPELRTQGADAGRRKLDPERIARKLRQSRGWNEFHARRLARLSRVAIRERDIVIFHSILRSTAASIARWIRSSTSGRGPVVVVALMFADHVSDDGSALREEYADLLDALRAYPAPKRFLVAETRELCDELRQLSDDAIPIEVAPHFKPEEALEALLETRRSSGRRESARIGYVGHNRRDRGSHLVPDILEHVAAHAPEPLRALVHFGEPGTQPGDVQRLREMPGVEFVAGGLPIHEYYRILGDIDIVLLPYEPRSRSETRGSGIFWESLVLGQVMVVPEGSVFHRELERVGGGYATYDEWNPRSIGEATVTALRDYARLEPKARAGGAKWLSNHRLSTFMDRVVSS